MSTAIARRSRPSTRSLIASGLPCIVAASEIGDLSEAGSAQDAGRNGGAETDTLLAQHDEASR